MHQRFTEQLQKAAATHIRAAAVTKSSSTRSCSTAEKANMSVQAGRAALLLSCQELSEAGCSTVEKASMSLQAGRAALLLARQELS